MRNSYNVLNENNFAQILSKSSEVRGCAAANVLSDNEKRLWLSEQGLPQELVFDLTDVKMRPEQCCGFGWYCWHAYKSNPAMVELWASCDLSHWVKWADFQGKASSGENLFRIEPLTKEYFYLKVVVCETFGSSNTYMNQVFLYEELGESVLKSVDESQEGKSFEELGLSPFKPAEDCSISKQYDPKAVHFHSFDVVKKPLFVNSEENSRVSGVSGDNSLVFNTGYKWQLPKIDEVARLRKEVTGWSENIVSMQQALETICDKVDRLTQTVSLEGSKSVVREIREEMQRLAGSEPGTWRSGLEGKYEEVFVREMERWENEVLKPDLMRIGKMVGGGRNAEEILREIDEKLRKKAMLVQKKELLKKLAAYKPKYV